MKNLITIKSNKHGILVHLDNTVPYEELLQEIKRKFKDSAKFFSKARMAISFEGRVLTMPQEKEIIELIEETADIDFVCIIDHNTDTEFTYKSIVDQAIEDMHNHEGQFYKGTLRKRQVLEAETSIIILGDVDQGAVVVSKGNIVVLGEIRGTVHAGASGDKSAFIVALIMQPKKLKIADVEAGRHAFVRKENLSMSAKIAAIDGERIYVDLVE